MLELSEYCTKIKDKFNIPNNQIRKLIPTLNNKKNYVVHCKNLELYLELGLNVTKVHRVLSFDQSPLLAEYIDFNTKMRSCKCKK